MLGFAKEPQRPTSYNQHAPLLLGQSVLKRLGRIEIDNERRLLRITTK